MYIFPNNLKIMRVIMTNCSIKAVSRRMVESFFSFDMKKLDHCLILLTHVNST